MRYGFFNSEITGYDSEGMPVFDRAEEASFFAKYFSQFISNGVYSNPSTNMQVLEKEGMKIDVNIGTCFINGYLGWIEETETLEIEETENQARIDRIVVRLDYDDRSIKLFVKQGTKSENPVAPDLQRDFSIYEIALAEIKVTRNTINITQEDITDLRMNTELCGWVTGVIKQVDTTALFKQYEDWYKRVTGKAIVDFNKWFDSIKAILDEDAAGNLQNEIEDLKEEIGELTEKTSQSDGVPIGTGMDYFGTEAPEGYLFADGAEVSRIDYPELFEVIGTIYGEGDGETTFNLPDKRECVSIMRKEGSTNGTEGATLDTLGAKGGEFKHTQTIEEMPSHTHIQEQHRHSFSAVSASTYCSKGSTSGDPRSSANTSTQYTGYATATNKNTGGGEPMNIMQTYLVCNYIIKVK